MNSQKSGAGRRFDFKFALVTVLCTIGAAASSYLLYLDFNTTGAKGQGKPLAKVERRESTVRRKASTTYVWTNVKTNEDLYKRDAIQTSTGSAATVKLADGSLLEMGENSLIIIDESMAEMSLNFLRGQLIVRRADGGDQKVTVGSDGKAKIEELPLWLVKPEPLAQLFVLKNGQGSPQRQIDFTWQVRNPRPGDELVVQVSKEKNFAVETTKVFKPATSGAFNVAGNLDVGKYFWRVTNGKDYTTEARQFRVTQASPLKTISPARGQKISVWKDLGGVDFRWTMPSDFDADEVGEHTLEISADRTFKNVLFNSKIKAAAGAASYKGIPAGQLYWRIKSKYGDLETASAIETFVLERTDKLALELGKPDENATIGVSTVLRFNWACDTDVEFNWVLETSDGKPFFSYKSRARAAEWKNPASGQYRWKVRALWNDQVVAETQWRNLNVVLGKPIALLKPLKEQAIYYWDEKDPAHFEFEWEQDASVEQKDYSFKIEVAKDVEFKEIIASETSKKPKLESEKLKLKASELFWRVKIVDNIGRLIKSSDPSPFTYGIFPPPRAPASVKPETGTKIDVIEHEKDLVASWTKVDTADEYEVVVKTIDAETKEEKTALKVVTKEITQDLKALKPGNYTITVQAIDRLKRAGVISAPQSFVLNTGNPPPPPAVTSPEVQ